MTLSTPSTPGPAHARVPARAFVTGIAGQDGSYLAERLLAEGVEVHALVHDGSAGLAASAGRVERPPYCPADVVLHPGDLTCADRTRELLLDLAPDEIYNLAALSSVARSWEEPELTAAVNGFGAVALLESAHRLQQSTGRQVRFVQASSAEIFGEPESSPQDEHTPIRPVNPYGAAKSYAHLAVDVYRHRDLHAVSAVLYNHESPRRPTRFVTRKITAGVAAIAQGRQDTLVLGNLDARRDWGWAPDYVDAMVRAARAERARDYVIATGEGHTVADFVAAAFARIGVEDWSGLVGTDPAFVRPADPAELVGDPSRARTELGWTPTVGFTELVGAMVEADLAEPAEPEAG